MTWMKRPMTPSSSSKRCAEKEKNRKRPGHRRKTRRILKIQKIRILTTRLMTASRALITNDDNAEDYYVHEADTRSTGIQNRVLKLSGINRKDRRIVHSLQGRYAGLFACRPQLVITRYEPDINRSHDAPMEFCLIFRYNDFVQNNRPIF